MQKIILTLFGAFSVFVNEEPLSELRLLKAKAMLAYLSSEPEQAYSRDVLMTLLWPESSIDQARNSLRIALYRIRDAMNKVEPGLSEQLLSVTRNSVQFNPGAKTQVDLLTFHQLFHAVSHHDHPSIEECPQCQQSLSSMAELYRGDFLSGMESVDAQPFEEWLLLQRESLRQQFLIALSNLARAYESAGDYGSAHRYATQQLQLDPFNEDAHRQTMRVLAKQGLADEAKSHFSRMKDLLDEELGVEPDPDTAELLEAIESGELATDMPLGEPMSPHTPVYPPETADSAPPLQDKGQHQMQDVEPGIQSPSKPKTTVQSAGSIDAVPLPGVRFGYSYEEGRLQDWLGSGECRLISVLGMVGAGKSTLAAAAVRESQKAFERVLWRSLRTAPSPAHFLSGIVQSLAALTPPQLPDSTEELLHLTLEQLNQRRVLLVLDDFDCVLDRQKPGQYGEGYEAYGQLVDLFIQWEHQSQLLLMSRTWPMGLPRIEAEMPTVRSLQLDGLEKSAAVALLDHLGLDGADTAKVQLIDKYAGNPLALKLAADAIETLHQGKLEEFLCDEIILFGEIFRDLAQQADSLSLDEEALLAIMLAEGETATVGAMRSELAPLWSQGRLIETLQCLQNRLMIAQTGGAVTAFSIQPVWASYLERRLKECPK